MKILYSNVHAVIIEKFNNTVIIQSSVSMYTAVYSTLLFSVTEGTTKPVSSDLKIHLRPSWAPVECATVVSVHVFAPAVSLASGCHLLTPTEEYACSLDSVIFKNTCNNVIALHVTILFVSWYIYIWPSYTYILTIEDYIYKFFRRIIDRLLISLNEWWLHRRAELVVWETSSGCSF